MSMPKGFKAAHGYATVTERGGKGYREIAEIMTRDGDSMKHSAARNYFLSGMRKVATTVCELYEMDNAEIERIALDPRFQESIADIMSENNGIDL